jgi:hypothetical protein
MIAKSNCQKCGQTFEFDLSEFEESGRTATHIFGQSIDCPVCGNLTVVTIKKTDAPEPLKIPVAKPPVSQKAKPKEPAASEKIAWICAAIFAVTSILFACLYLSEKHSLQRTETALQRIETALDMAEKSEAELRSSVQAPEAVAKDNVSELAAEGRQALSGIYYCQQAIWENELDLRSDGSAVWLNDSSGQKLGTSKWETDGDTVTVGGSQFTVGGSQFKIEGSDLIDSRGNRWLHIR